MQDFLRKIKLIDHLKTELQIDKQTFIERLSAIVDKDSVGLFEVFLSSKNEYKGFVMSDKFKLKKRQKLFDTGYNMATAQGKLTGNDGKLTIETEIKGVNIILITFYLPLILFYSVVTFLFISDRKGAFLIFPFIFLQGFFTFVFSIPYRIMKRNVERLKYELEREFFYLTKND